MKSDVFANFSAALKDSFAAAVAEENDALIDDLIAFLEQRRSTPRVQPDYEEFDCDTCGTRFKPLKKVVTTRHAYCSEECRDTSSEAPAQPEAPSRQVAAKPEKQTSYFECAACHQTTPRNGPRQKYCTPCSHTVNKPAPRTFECETCHNVYPIGPGRVPRFCKACKPIRYVPNGRKRGPRSEYEIEPEKRHLFLDEPEAVEPIGGKDYDEYKNPDLSRFMKKLPEGIVGHGVA